MLIGFIENGAIVLTIIQNSNMRNVANTYAVNGRDIFATRL